MNQYPWWRLPAIFCGLAIVVGIPTWVLTTRIFRIWRNNRSIKQLKEEQARREEELAEYAAQKKETAEYAARNGLLVCHRCELRVCTQGSSMCWWCGI